MKSGGCLLVMLNLNQWQPPAKIHVIQVLFPFTSFTSAHFRLHLTHSAHFRSIATAPAPFDHQQFLFSLNTHITVIKMSFQDKAQHQISQIDKEVREHMSIQATAIQLFLTLEHHQSFFEASSLASV